MLDLPNNLHERANQLLDLCPVEEWDQNAYQFLKGKLEKGNFICAACSGGPDSTFALLLMTSAFPKFISQITILHYNHGLRGNESNTDEILVRGLAEKLGLKCIVEYPSQKQTKIDENTLREQRIEFFKRVQNENGIKGIVQGHHLDDIAETLLWRIPRGVSVDGLISPKPVSSLGELIFVRPFISLSKAQIRNSLEKCSIPWREDSTNRENNYLRNKIRNMVLPIWEKSLDRELLKGIKSTRKLLEEDSKALEFHAMQAFEQCISGEGLNLGILKDLPLATQRRVISKWIEEHINKNKFGPKFSLNFGRLIELINNEGFSSIQLSENWILTKKSTLLELSEVQSTSPLPFISVPANSIIFLPNGRKISAERLKLTHKLASHIFQKKVNQCEHAYISDRFGESRIFARSRIKGETYQPMGSPGSKKLSDWMIDRKWSDVEKTETPIFLNSDNKILWVPGFPPADFSKVKELDVGVIRLTYSRSATY